MSDPREAVGPCSRFVTVGESVVVESSLADARRLLREHVAEHGGMFPAVFTCTRPNQGPRRHALIVRISELPFEPDPDVLHIAWRSEDSDGCPAFAGRLTCAALSPRRIRIALLGTCALSAMLFSRAEGSGHSQRIAAAAVTTVLRTLRTIVERLHQ